MTPNMLILARSHVARVRRAPRSKKKQLKYEQLIKMRFTVPSAARWLSRKYGSSSETGIAVAANRTRASAKKIAMNFILN